MHNTHCAVACRCVKSQIGWALKKDGTCVQCKGEAANYDWCESCDANKPSMCTKCQVRCAATHRRVGPTLTRHQGFRTPALPWGRPSLLLPRMRLLCHSTTLCRDC